MWCDKHTWKYIQSTRAIELRAFNRNEITIHAITQLVNSRSTKLSNVIFHDKLIQVLGKNYLNVCERMAYFYNGNFCSSFNEITDPFGRRTLKAFLKSIITETFDNSI